MFSAIHSSTLGKSGCGCTKGTPYTPSNSAMMDVSFLPIKNTTGTVNYVALIENENKKVKTSIPKELVIENDEYDDSNENNKTIDIFDLENDYVKTFYIGSITVVGLYILYRILDKSK
jgi:hypothetical protein